MKAMMKRSQKKMGNKGFSLVELIVVIAIMAVLVVVLAPQFIKYVESSREANDKNTASEIYRAVQVSAAEEDVYNAIVNAGTSGLSVTWASATTGNNGAVAPETHALGEAVRAAVASTAKRNSKTYSGQVYTVNATYSSSDKTITYTEGWSTTP